MTPSGHGRMADIRLRSKHLTRRAYGPCRGARVCFQPPQASQSLANSTQRYITHALSAMLHAHECDYHLGDGRATVMLSEGRGYRTQGQNQCRPGHSLCRLRFSALAHCCLAFAHPEVVERLAMPWTLRWTIARWARSAHSDLTGMVRFLDWRGPGVKHRVGQASFSALYSRRSIWPSPDTLCCTLL